MNSLDVLIEHIPGQSSGNYRFSQGNVNENQIWTKVLAVALALNLGQSSGSNHFVKLQGHQLVCDIKGNCIVICTQTALWSGGYSGSGL